MPASKNVCEENHGNVVWHGKTEKTIKKDNKERRTFTEDIIVFLYRMNRRDKSTLKYK